MNPLKKIRALVDRAITWWHRRQYRKQFLIARKTDKLKLLFKLVEPKNPIEIQRFGKGKKLPAIRLQLAEYERVRATFMPGDGAHCPESKLFFDEKARIE